MYGTYCEFVAKPGAISQVADAKSEFWWGWCAGVRPGCVFYGEPKHLNPFPREIVEFNRLRPIVNTIWKEPHSGIG